MTKKKTKAEDLESLIAEENIVDCDIKQELSKSYMDYTMLSIIDRALPDVRDGLKPVQRRILYCCDEKGYDYNKAYIKNAKISGDVMGTYHPHSSCYGTIANMAKEWVFRYPLIDFHGNSGSIDGDAEGSERYTEGRLPKIAYTLLEDVLDKQCVEFKPNYAETTTEPITLPALFPNFLANGCPTGIAVGYTSCVPSHNLNELCDGIIYAIKNENYTLDDIMKYIVGPDFPYASNMLKDGIKELYQNGSGKLSFRANYIVETNEENGNPQIVFTDMPPYSDKPKIVEKIHELITEKTLPRALYVRDESTGMNIRIVVECQKTANIPLIIKDIFAKTKLQANASFYMRGVVDKELKLVSLMDYIGIYISYRKNVLTKRYNYLVAESKKKLNIQQGLAKVIDDIKTAVNIIIDSDDVNDAKEKLIKKYNLNNEQVEYILEQKTRSLVHKDRNSIFDKIKTIENLIQEYNGYLSDDTKLKQLMVDQLQELKKSFGDERRTKLVDSFDDNNGISETVSENVIAVLYSNGKINIYEEDEYEPFEKDKSYKDKTNMFVNVVKCKRDDDIIVITKSGIAERMPISALQYNNTKVDGAITIFKFDTESNKTLFTILTNANVKKTAINKFKFKVGKQTPIIKDINTEIVCNLIIDDTADEIVNIATENGYFGRFSVNSFNSTACGAGTLPTCVLEDNDVVVDCKISKNNPNDKILAVFETKDGKLSYKVIESSEMLVKGRRARALQIVDGRSFNKLVRIEISNESFILLDAKNREYVFDKYSILKRSTKNGEEFKHTLCVNWFRSE